MTYPNFIIAGAARCGTTSLYYYLKQHPQIGLPVKKEPKYFSSLGMVFPHCGPGDHSVDEGIIRDLEEYERLFQGLEGRRRIGEASSDYLYYHHCSAKAIRDTVGDIPIIVILRDPVERAFSAYNNLVRDQRESLSFADALAAEEKRAAENWDWMWAYKAGGMYGAQVETFQKTFSQVKVVLLEELSSDAQSVVKDLLEFLDVDSSVPINTADRYSHSGNSPNMALRWCMQRDNPLAFRLRKIMLAIFPRSLLERLAAKILRKEKMADQEKSYLREWFREDVERLEELLGRDLSCWKGSL